MNYRNEPSRKGPASKDSRGGLVPAVLGLMVVLATAGGNTAIAQARSLPADGGLTGLVDTTFAGGFTMTTATGIEVTVNETPFTQTVEAPGVFLGGLVDGYVRKGTSVLVVGLDNTSTITADWVVIQPHGDGGAAAAKANGVIPFESGVPSPVQSVGTIPASYTQGTGTLVSGTQAYFALLVAQTVFPGGVVDRVVSLSDGSYEVHNISINWPHHVFVSEDFKYLGAE